MVYLGVPLCHSFLAQLVYNLIWLHLEKKQNKNKTPPWCLNLDKPQVPFVIVVLEEVKLLNVLVIKFF